MLKAEMLAQLHDQSQTLSTSDANRSSSRIHSKTTTINARAKASIEAPEAETTVALPSTASFAVL